MGRYAEAAAKARELTNKQLGEELSALAPVNERTFKKLLPLRRDKDAFLELMQKVEHETQQDEALAFLIENVHRVGGVVLKALKIYL